MNNPFIIINGMECSGVDRCCYNCVYSKQVRDGQDRISVCRLDDMNDSKDVCEYWSISIEKWNQLNKEVQIQRRSA